MNGSSSLQSVPVPSIGIETGDLLLIIFLCILATYIVFSAIFHYHWKQYGTNKKMTTLTFVVFGITTLPLLGLLAILALVQ